MRNHAGFTTAFAASVLVIGFGLIGIFQAAQSGSHPISDGWFRAGIVVACLGGLILLTSLAMYVGVTRKRWYGYLDHRRHELKTGERLKTDRSLYSASGRARLHMDRDGNVIEWVDGWIVLWKTDTEGSGSKNYLMLKSGGTLVVCRGDHSVVKPIPGTENSGGTRLVLQDDTNLVLRRDDGSPVWATGQAVGVVWGAQPAIQVPPPVSLPRWRLFSQRR